MKRPDFFATKPNAAFDPVTALRSVSGCHCQLKTHSNAQVREPFDDLASENNVIWS